MSLRTQSRHSGVKRFNVNSLAEVMRELQGSHNELGVVTKLDGESGHWFKTDDGDVAVSVVMHNHEVPMWCLLGALIGGPGKGLYGIPPVGTEVLVAFPGGDFEGDPVITNCLATDGIPDDLDDTKLLVVGMEVWIYDGSGTPEPVVKKSEFDAHKHSGFLGGTGSALAQTTVPSDATHSANPVDGTTVLKAK